ncbi:hypothetical protein EV426DRAFT_601128 [Tirmania nivea]|nr:hypothetical protein EV426DRAFT_601128 [Tirmania nivea]
MVEPKIPKLPSSFPASPAPARQQARVPGMMTQIPPARPPQLSQKSVGPEEIEPRIPTNVIDAPTQRFYAVTVFLAIQAIKIADIAKLYTGDEGDSISELMFCFKWVAIDGLFFWFLPFMRIPWLTFSPSTTFLQIFGSFVINMCFTFKYSFVPFSSICYSIWKTIYDRELSLSERSVKIYDITHNSSHIQGKYTVHILPEGAAMLNPDQNCYCLDDTSSSSIVLPIRINGTEPLIIQLMKADFETGELQTIDIKEKETKKLLKQAKRDEDPNLRYLQYTVKSPGLYRLTKVRDVSQLDVRITQSEALVVQCPRASIQVADVKKRDRCSGDLSDLSVAIEGLAPLDIKYSRIVKDTPIMFQVSRIYTENFQSPLLSGWNKKESLLRDGTNLKWGRRETINMPLNEALSSPGDWTYAIDSVRDACGNLRSYTRESEDGERLLPKAEHLSHTFTVHGRPQASFLRCDPLNPMSLPPGRETSIQFNLDFQKGDGPYTLQYVYSPHENTEPGDKAIEPVVKDVKIKTQMSGITINEPGLYTLKSIANKYCQGEVMEPSTCLVITPPKPSVAITHENILDKCSASSVGVTIDVTLVGTAPFNLWYRLIRDGATTEVKKFVIDRTRYQATITPSTAGHYVYEFYRLDDKWNEGLVLDHTKLRVEQTIKPLAGATFADNVSVTRKACIEQPVEFKINLQGIGPWKLKYDLIHAGKRKHFEMKNITEPVYTIRTPSLNVGGKYGLALVTVEDVSGCQIFLDSEAKIDVRFEKPRAAFAPVDGKMSIRALEGKEVSIPLRMRGEKPWALRVRNLDFPNEPPIVQTVEESNSHLRVKNAGRYELMDVKDVAACPGTITDTAKSFEITWIERPTIRLSESTVQKRERENSYVRKDVCEGDEDAVELGFTGSPPFHAQYLRSVKADGSTTTGRKKLEDIRAGNYVTTVRLDTSSPGQHRYEFVSIADSLYDDPKEARLPKALVLSQKVNAKPSAKFVDTPGKMYRYCRDAGAGDDIIPIQLAGVPPFQLQINIKHHNTGKNEIVNIPAIETNQFNFKIPPHALTLGSHSVSVLKVRDSRGCVRKTAPQDAPFVYVAVADLPTIAPEETRNDYCVGDRISYSLQGSPPFAVEYVFENVVRKASSGARFSRVAPGPGNFTITGLLDSASDCKVHLQLTKIIHEIPSVRISEGTKGIHEGDQAEIHFQFFGTPPFTFTYTRSEIPRKGGKPRVMEQHSQTTDEFTYSMYASQEGTYEVTSIEDKYCSYSAKGRK